MNILIVERFNFLNTNEYFLFQICDTSAFHSFTLIPASIEGLIAHNCELSPYFYFNI